MGADDDPTKPAVPRAIQAVPAAPKPAPPKPVPQTPEALLATGDWTAALAQLASDVRIVRSHMGDVGAFLTNGKQLLESAQKTVEDVRSSFPPPASGELAPRPSLAAKAAKKANVWGHRLAVAIAVASIAGEFIAARYPHETGPLGAILEIVHVLTARPPSSPSSGAPRVGVTVPSPDAGARDEWSPPP
jgi:hypothetical protein